MVKRSDKKVNMKYNLSEYFSFLKNYKLYLFLALFFVLLVELRQVAEKFLFKIVVDNGTSFAAGALDYSGFVKILILVAIAFIASLILSAIAKWLYLHFVNLLECNTILDLKRKYFNHIVELDHGFHVSHKTGSLISRLGRGSRAMERMTDVIIYNVAPLIFQLLAIVGSLVYFDVLSSVVIFFVILVFIIYSWITLNLQRKANLDANEAEDIEKANIGDIFTNIDSIKYFGKENFIKNKYEKLAKATKNLTIKHWNYFRWSDSGQSFIIGLGTFALVYFSIMQLLNGKITLGTVTFIYTSYIGLMGPLWGFMHGIREYYRSMADFQDLFEYGKVKKEILDNKDAKSLDITNGKIEFKDVSFNYGKRNIFKSFNLVIPENKKIALVGHSGSGKTTLVKLLYRLYDVNSGSISIDGKDIKSITQESLKNEMSIVPQECILFDDTVYNNIAFSKPNATRLEVMKAINFAQLDKIIKKFPNKENTIVGERGVKLSGGEKQRVSIARAILANKKVLVLDEATSSLDSETEHEIQADLKELMKNRTSIIIAHRLSTIMNTDQIIVMKEGKIVQKGTHQELINKPGEYKKLWNLQKGGYIGE